MKQVNRNFLEEQVRIALKEQQKEDKWGDTTTEMAADVVLGLPFGSPSSYIQLKDYLSDIGMYGFGADAAYKKALDELGKIEKAGARAPFSQLMLRFYKTMPLTGDKNNAFDPSTLNLAPNEELAAELADVKRYGYSKILPIMKIKKLAGGQSKVSAVENILRVMAHRNNLTSLDESLEDIAESYGFVESSLSYVRSPWGSKGKFTPVTLFKTPSALEKAGMYQEFAKDILKSGPSKLGENLEQFIMFHFNGLEDANFRKAMVRLQVRSNLPKVAKAHMAYTAASQGGFEAIMSTADIVLSTVTTVAFIAGAAAAPFTAGGSAAVGIGAKVAAVTGIKALRSFIGKSALKYAESGVVQSAVRLSQAQGKAGSTLKALDGIKAQLSPLALLAGKIIGSGFMDWYHDLERNNKIFISKYADKTEEERIKFFENDIKPSYARLAEAHVELMTTAGFDSKYLTTRVADINTVRQMYASFDKKQILSLQKNINETTKNLTQLGAMFSQTSEKLEKTKEVQSQIEASNRKAEEIMNSGTPKLPIAAAFKQTGVAAPQEEPEEPEQETDKAKTNVNSSDLFFVGDSIAQGMRDNAAGSDGVTHVGQTSAYVLNQLRKRFAADKAINEAQQGKTAVISVGTNDAFNAGAGGNYTAEKTLNNIKEIVKLLKQNGYQEVKVMPLFQDGKPGRTKINKYDFNQEKHRQFVDKFNSGLTAAGLSTFDNNVALAGDGIHPKNYNNLLSKALSGASVASSSKTIDTKATKKPVKKAKLSGKAAEYWPMVKRLSKEGGIDPALVMGVIFAESGFNRKAVSHVGAQGLMQLMPSVQKQFGVTDVYDPEQNIRAGIKTLKIIRNKYIPFEMKRAKTKISYDTLTDEQKTRLGLYGFNWGARGIVSKLKMNQYDNIDDFLARVNAWYLTKHGYDYADKIFKYANANGASFSSLPVTSSTSVSKPIQTQTQAAPSEKEEEKFRTNTENIETEIKAVEDAESLGQLIGAFSDLFGMSLGSVYLNTAEIRRAAGYMEKQDLSDFVDRRIQYLKAQHSNNYSKWKATYQKDVKAAGSDKDLLQQAERKMAWFHRPIFYVTLAANDVRKFFGGAPKISFGFEPNSSRISASYRGRDTFYKEDTAGNAAYQRFLSELTLLKKATNAIVEKVNSLQQGADQQDSEIIEKFKRYILPMNNIVSSVSDSLSDRGMETSRKAYMITILDLALRTT